MCIKHTQSCSGTVGVIGCSWWKSNCMNVVFYWFWLACFYFVLFWWYCFRFVVYLYIFLCLQRRPQFWFALFHHYSLSNIMQEDSTQTFCGDLSFFSCHFCIRIRFRMVQLLIFRSNCTQKKLTKQRSKSPYSQSNSVFYSWVCRWKFVHE